MRDGVRGAARSLQERLGGALIRLGLRASVARSGSLVLAWHNIVPDGEAAVGDRSLHLAERQFVAQLDALAEHAEVIPLADVSTPGPAHGFERPRVALTFDDAYTGAVQVGLAELARRRWPATMFVAPQLLEGASFWWDELADGRSPERYEAAISHARFALAGDQDAVRHWALAEGLSLGSLPAHARGCQAGELADALAANAGLVLGAHSWSHPNLSRVTGQRLRDELQRPLSWFAAHGFRHAPMLAYPYGDWGVAAAELAASMGYQKALCVNGGWYDPARGAEAMKWPRRNIPAGLSAGGLSLRLAGLLP